MTMSGEVRKALVLALPSLRRGKLRLKLVTMVLSRAGPESARSHWPMQGPQAFARTVPPMASRSASSPSRSTVARTCSEPGVIRSGDLARKPCAAAWRAIDAALVMSS
jgi:hypothetical protein